MSSCLEGALNRFVVLNTQFMKHNMGNIDRIVRILIAVVIAVLYFTNTITGTLGYVLLAVGGVFLFTSLVGSRPLYSLVGMNTCSTKKAQ
jgi:uncharacterized membrane protein YccC